MGRNESGSVAAVAVIIVGGVLLLLVAGCVAVGAVGFLFAVRSPPPQVMSQPIAVPPAQTISPSPPAHVITNSADGQAIIDGKTLTDEEFRSTLEESNLGESHAPDYVLQLSADLTLERRAVIEQIFTEATGAASKANVNPNPFSVFPTE